MNRTEKNQQIEQLHSQLSEARNVFLIDVTGLKVVEVTDLRRRIKSAAGTCRVVKNRLASRAVKGTSAELLAERFRGPIGIVSHPSDPLSLAKVLAEFSKDHPALEMRAASVDGKLAEPEEIAALAALPGANELRAMLLGVLSAPATKLVRLLSTPGSQLARALSGHKDKMEKGKE